MKSVIASFIDNLVVAVAIWLFAALVSLYFLDEIYLVVICATTVTMGASLLLRLKTKKTALLEKDKYNAGLASEHFLFKDDVYALEYFYKALTKRYVVTKHTYFLRINGTMVVPYLTEPLPLKKAVFFYSEALRLKLQTLVILTYKTEKYPINLKDKLTDIRLEIFDSLKTYKLLKSLNSLPKYDKPARTHKLKKLAASAFNPKRAKGYLFTSFALLFGAYFTVLSLYFIVMSAVCLTMLILCKLNIAERFSREKKQSKV